jgi:hypothetical protein
MYDVSGQMHISDWLPTLMNLATNGQWTGSYSGTVLDGVNMWEAITTNDPSQGSHSEIIHYVDDEGKGTGSMQVNMIKLDYGLDQESHNNISIVFDHDAKPSNSRYKCDINNLEFLSAFNTLFTINKIESFNPTPSNLHPTLSPTEDIEDSKQSSIKKSSTKSSNHQKDSNSKFSSKNKKTKENSVVSTKKTKHRLLPNVDTTDNSKKSSKKSTKRKLITNYETIQQMNILNRIQNFMIQLFS